MKSISGWGIGKHLFWFLPLLKKHWRNVFISNFLSEALGLNCILYPGKVISEQTNLENIILYLQADLFLHVPLEEVHVGGEGDVLHHDQAVRQGDASQQ